MKFKPEKDTSNIVGLYVGELMPCLFNGLYSGSL